MYHNTLHISNERIAKKIWPVLSRLSLQKLRTLSQQNLFSLSAGDLTYLASGWYVTHVGLLHVALRKRCAGIDVTPLNEFCDAPAARWAFKAVVYKSRACKGFVGYGDADPSNVSPLVRGAEMRVAETRAVNRALRKAYGIGICSAEELGSLSGPEPTTARQQQAASRPERSNGNDHHPLRDRLCLLIRQHQLDPALVKAYAADYCDVSELRQAGREQVATFIKHLAEYAQSDREGLLCQLNSYAPTPASKVLVTIANDSTAEESEKAAGAA